MSRYDRAIALIRSTIDDLNTDLGLTDERRVTFGYIGNLRGEPGGPNDDRLWSIFLPHPGRLGRPDDAIGGFRTGDTGGAVAALAWVCAFRQGIRWAASEELAASRRDA